MVPELGLAAHAAGGSGVPAGSGRSEPARSFRLRSEQDAGADVRFERRNARPHLFRNIAIDVHHEVTDVRVGVEDLALHVRVELADDGVDAAQHAGHVAVDVEDAVATPQRSAARPSGS